MLLTDFIRKSISSALAGPPPPIVAPTKVRTFEQPQPIPTLHIRPTISSGNELLDTGDHYADNTAIALQKGSRHESHICRYSGFASPIQAIGDHRRRVQ